MSEELLKQQILEGWKAHANAIRSATGEEGPLLNTIDMSRENAIEVVKIIIHNFLKGDFDIHEFKTALDSYNRHNNLWGYTTKLGQMYFNQLIKANETHPDKLSNMLREIITEPKNIKEAIARIDTLESFTQTIYNKAKDKHSAPYPGAAGYFLSYFWQIANYQKWPVLYNTLINAFRELNVWEEQKTQKETYNLYYSVYNSIRKTIEEAENRKVGYWEIEHAFWNFKAKPLPLPLSEEDMPAQNEVQASEAASSEGSVNATLNPAAVPAETQHTEASAFKTVAEPSALQAVNVREYLIPRLHSLLDNTFSTADVADSEKYGQLVAEAFAQMGFELETCNQSAGKNALAILRYREENIAYILDAHADSNAFFKDNDRRLVKEYINDACNILRREGYKRTAYVLVSGQFSEEQKTLASFIDWNTEVRKTFMIDTRALLHLLAFKLQNRLSLYRLLERMAELPPHLDAGNIAAELGRTNH